MCHNRGSRKHRHTDQGRQEEDYDEFRHDQTPNQHCQRKGMDGISRQIDQTARTQGRLAS